MRKNTQRVFEAWQKGALSVARDCGTAIWTDGQSIYSYQTCIATRDPEDVHGANGKSVIFNNSRYSPTTSQQQGGMRFLMRQAGYQVEAVAGDPGQVNLLRGVTTKDLLAAARRAEEARYEAVERVLSKVQG